MFAYFPCCKIRKLIQSCNELIFFSEGEFEQGSYLAPFTCAEMGFMFLDNGDLTTGKNYLEMAK